MIKARKGSEQRLIHLQGQQPSKLAVWHTWMSGVRAGQKSATDGKQATGL